MGAKADFLEKDIHCVYKFLKTDFSVKCFDAWIIQCQMFNFFPVLIASLQSLQSDKYYCKCSLTFYEELLIQ